MIIIKQGDDKKLEVFDIPDNILQEHQLGSADVAHDSCLKDKIDLYKMEYERCAQRYDDLYKAAWTNFSYMALIAGAILTFGSDSFMAEVSISLACLPLLFWWAASFEPLNHYGDQVQMRLVGIESVLNRLCQLKHEKDEDFDNNRGLRHFKDFEKRSAGSVKRWKRWLCFFIWVFGLLIALDRLGHKNLPPTVSLLGASMFLIIWYVALRRDARAKKITPRLLRVRHVVRLFGGAILIVAICAAYGAYLRRHQIPGEPYIRRTSSERDLKAIRERLGI